MFVPPLGPLVRGAEATYVRREDDGRLVSFEVDEVPLSVLLGTLKLSRTHQGERVWVKSGDRSRLYSTVPRRARNAATLRVHIERGSMLWWVSLGEVATTVAEVPYNTDGTPRWNDLEAKRAPGVMGVCEMAGERGVLWAEMVNAYPAIQAAEAQQLTASAS